MHENELLMEWLLQYGGITLFVLLALGIVALPVPEETLLVVTGILLQNEKMPFITTVFFAYLGAIFGITVSYLIGRSLGVFVLKKYGKKVGITEKKLEQVHEWFEKYGKWTLVIGYFIPGVRHLTGLFAGATVLEYPVFALFAYTGAFLWVSNFLTVGYFFGAHWFALYEMAQEHILEVAVSIAVLVATYFYLTRKNS